MVQLPSSAPSGLPAASLWDVIVTEWGLHSYIRLKAKQTFTDAEYWGTIRPDVELLRWGWPPPAATQVKFSNHKFWSQVYPDGYKMKWHQMGTGLVQLRLPVMLSAQAREAYLCEAYAKSTPAAEKRNLARFKTHMNLIAQGTFTKRGKL